MSKIQEGYEGLMKTRFVRSIALAIALGAAAATFAQFPGMSQPKHFPWSDSKLSPDSALIW